MSRRKKRTLNSKVEDIRTLIGVILLIISLSIFSSGFITAGFLVNYTVLLGLNIYILPFILLLLSIRLLGNRFKYTRYSVITSLFLSDLFLSGILSLWRNLAGGKVGSAVNLSFVNIFGHSIAFVALSLLFVFFAIIGLSIPIIKVSKFIKQIINKLIEIIQSITVPIFLYVQKELKKYKNRKREKVKISIKNEVNSYKTEPIGSTVIEEVSKNDLSARKRDLDETSMMVGDLSGKNKLENEVKPIGKSLGGVSINKFSEWRFPDISLLIKPKPFVVQSENVNRNTDIIERTLKSFGILARVADIKIGPTITQYAIQIPMGTKVTRINTLDKDIALALAAPSGVVRVEAPIPGTSLIGIEVPNSNPRAVTLRELFESNEWRNSSSCFLPMAIGRDVAGNIIIKDIQKLPHLLIAGSTGSGKSVAVNSIIISLLFKHSPNTLKFIMVDPKQVELSAYNGIGHLLVPVITNMEKVVSALRWAVAEMEERYTLCKELNVRNITSYNELDSVEKMPFIVIVIDEMADLMMIKGIEVESLIVRLAQMARAVGIHLVLATQRPSVNVITGLIKANVPARIGMSVASVIDSRVILDTGGAETLLGKGDLLFKSPDSVRTIRIQGVMVTDEEIEKILKVVKDQCPVPVYDETVLSMPGNNETGYQKGQNIDELDQEFKDAVRVVYSAQKGSASILQTKLKIGYAKAARIIDQLEREGVVGLQNGSKPREVLINDPETFFAERGL